MLAALALRPELIYGKKTPVSLSFEDYAIHAIMLIRVDKTLKPPARRSENTFLLNAFVYTTEDFVLYGLPLPGVIPHKKIAAQAIVLALDHCRAEFFYKQKTFVSLFLKNEAFGAVVPRGLHKTAKFPALGDQIFIEFFADRNDPIITDEFEQIFPLYPPVPANGLA